MTDYDTTEKVERTDKGYRLAVECKRGTGTRHQDKVKAEMRTESLAQLIENRPTVTGQVKSAMEDMRLFDDPAQSEDDEGGDD